MRNDVAVAAAALVAGLGVIAWPRARGPERAGDRIVVVPGAAAANVPAFRREPAPATPALVAASSAPDAPAVTADGEGEPGVWATPAEFDQPEPPS